MSKTTVYIITDETEVVERAKTYFAAQGVNAQAFTPHQWREGMENPVFRSQMQSGLPSLSLGQSPLEKNNILPFPGQTIGSSSVLGSTSGEGSHDRVATMNELEAKAIENAIVQFRGNLTEAAKALGIGRATLYRKVKQYEIDPSMARKRRAA